MIRRPPSSTRTDTLFPSTTLFRSAGSAAIRTGRRSRAGPSRVAPPMPDPFDPRSEEHTSELQSLMRISYAVFCLKKKKLYHTQITTNHSHLKNKQDQYHHNYTHDETTTTLL